MGEDSFPPSEEPVIRTIAMPADTNPAGDIFGGWLMAQMDLAAGNAAMRQRAALVDDVRPWLSTAWFSIAPCSSGTR